MPPQISLIYILSSGHSGSTLTDLILGSHTHIESVGELFQLPKYFSNDPTSATEQICTCGLAVQHCSYWSHIINSIEPQKIKGINTFNKSFCEYNYEVMHALLELSGKPILLDSSKLPARLENLLKSNLFNIQIIHLIRDGRAVGFSGKSKYLRILKEQSNNGHSKALKNSNKHLYEKYNYWSTIRKWNRFNSDCYRRFGNLRNYQILKYEDLVENPEKSLNRLLDKFDYSFQEEQLRFYNFEHHNIDGNRMRMLSNQKIVRDIRYLKNLSLWEWWLGTIIGKSSLNLFGYPFIREKP